MKKFLMIFLSIFSATLTFVINSAKTIKAVSDNGEVLGAKTVASSFSPWVTAIIVIVLVVIAIVVVKNKKA